MQWLVAFQRVAEHLSFTRAAAELNVTQPAMSHKIRQLEAHLGVKLFLRAGRGIALTREGEIFLSAVEDGLVRMAGAATMLSQPMPHVTIRTDAEFASFWLLPVIAQFNARHPRIVTSIVSDQGETVPDPSSPDLDITFGDGNWPGAKSRRLFYEEVFPVCSPSYLESSGRIEGLEDLARQTLLGWHASRWDFMDWGEWFERRGARYTDSVSRMIFDNYHVAMQAAVNGQGIALAWRYCLGDLLKKGLLVRPVPDTVITQRGQFLVEPLNAEVPQVIQRLVQWIIDSSRETLNEQERMLGRH
ncbi:LysR substrate-binding domain-containing protein [Afifella pfennigii]|uniref:LysR substrate-binding domain-containing protein n=1 Tax=Afifella pfennigii TaxID=209897 RepID=UPI00146FC1B8|nr:LysR substrate-binding domain-containing protein [Afifella pfennigii]